MHSSTQKITDENTLPIIILDIDETLITSVSVFEKDIVKKLADIQIENQSKLLAMDFHERKAYSPVKKPSSQRSLSHSQININLTPNDYQSNTSPQKSPRFQRAQSIKHMMRTKFCNSPSIRIFPPARTTANKNKMDDINDHMNVAMNVPLPVTSCPSSAKNSPETLSVQSSINSSKYLLSPLTPELQSLSITSPTFLPFSPETTREDNCNRSSVRNRRRLAQSKMIKSRAISNKCIANINPLSSFHQRSQTMKHWRKADINNTRESMKMSNTMDLDAYQPIPGVMHDMIHKSRTTAGKYYYIYFRPGVHEFLETLFRWQQQKKIYLCIMTAGTKFYANDILENLCNSKMPVDALFDAIVCKEDLPYRHSDVYNAVKKVKQLQRNSILSAKNSNSDEENAGKEGQKKLKNRQTQTESEILQTSIQLRRCKTIDIIFKQLNCNPKSLCLMVDDRMANFTVKDKYLYCYNILDYSKPELQNEFWMDTQLKRLQNFIGLLLKLSNINNGGCIANHLEQQLNGLFSKYILNACKHTILVTQKNLKQFRRSPMSMMTEHEIKCHKIIERSTLMARKIEGIANQSEMLAKVLHLKCETLQYKLLQAKQLKMQNSSYLITSDDEKNIGDGQKQPKSASTNVSTASLARFRSKAHQMIEYMDFASFEFMDRYLMAGLIRIKGKDTHAFANKCEFFGTIALFYRLYFIMTEIPTIGIENFVANPNQFVLYLYACNVLVRQQLYDYDGQMLMKNCEKIFGDLFFEQQYMQKKTESLSELKQRRKIQKRIARKMLYEYLKSVQYHIQPPIIFNGLFKISEIADIIKDAQVLDKQTRIEEKQYILRHNLIEPQNAFFAQFQKYTDLLAAVIFESLHCQLIGI